MSPGRCFQRRRRRRTGSMRPGFALAVGLAVVAPLLRAQEVPPIRVFAAASLTDVVRALAPGFAGARVEPSFGASSTLARQIADGAPADVFLSASPEWIDFLREKGALDGEPVVLARNRLVAVAGTGSPLAVAVVSDPAALLARIGPGGRVAIADEGVPAGEYARAALRRLGLLDAFAPHLVGQADVRAVLRAVESGELEAGFVYATEAEAADVAELFAFDPATYPPIEYLAVVLRTAPRPAEARRFLDDLRSEEARAVLAGAGFMLPGARGRGADVAGVAEAVGGAEREVILLSLRVAALAVAASLVPGILIGWLLARWRHPLRALAQGVVMLPLVLPPVATGYLLLFALGRSRPLGRAWHALTGGQVAYTTTACVVAAAVVGFPLLVEAIRLSILGVDPRLEQVSRSLGRGPLDTFFRVTLPLALPGLSAGAILCFARALGEFGATIVVAGNVAGETRTIPVAVYTLLNQRGGEAGVVRLVTVSVVLALAALLASFWFSARRRAA